MLLKSATFLPCIIKPLHGSQIDQGKRSQKTNRYFHWFKQSVSLQHRKSKASKQWCTNYLHHIRKDRPPKTTHFKDMTQYNVWQTSSASRTKATTWALIRFFLDCIMLNEAGPFCRSTLCNQPAVSTWDINHSTIKITNAWIKDWFIQRLRSNNYK